MGISERRFFLIILDLLDVNGALIISLSLRPEYDLTWRLIYEHPFWFIILSLLWLLIGSAFDVYDLRIAGKFKTISPAILKASLVTCAIFLLIPYISPALPSSRLLLFSFFILTLLSILAGRSIYLLLLSHPIFQQKALIIGTDQRANSIAEEILANSIINYNLLGFIERKSNGDPIDVSNSNCQKSINSPGKILGDLRSLPDVIKKHRIDTLILGMDQSINGQELQTLIDSLELGVEIIPMSVLYEELTGCVPVEHAGESWLLDMPINHPLTDSFNRFVKRASDIILASLGCLCLAPFFPFIALAIYLESPGPIFYIQERVGRGGRIFRAYKFRSMIPDAEKDRPVWAEKNDPRVTKVGRILRKTHVDEFPQFINILKGEMSAVGPRPERPEFVEKLAKEIPFYRVRHAVKPGMAGWGLVKYGYASSREDSIIKLQYDLYYIKHWSLWFDFIILLKTIIDTVTFRGRA